MLSCMDGHRCCLVKSVIIHTDQLTDVCIISTGGRFTAVEGNVYKTPFVVNNREEKKKLSKYIVYMQCYFMYRSSLGFSFCAIQSEYAIHI